MCNGRLNASLTFIYALLQIYVCYAALPCGVSYIGFIAWSSRAHRQPAVWYLVWWMSCQWPNRFIWLRKATVQIQIDLSVRCFVASRPYLTAAGDFQNRCRIPLEDWLNGGAPSLRQKVMFDNVCVLSARCLHTPAYYPIGAHQRIIRFIGPRQGRKLCPAKPLEGLLYRNNHKTNGLNDYSSTLWSAIAFLKGNWMKRYCHPGGHSLYFGLTTMYSYGYRPRRV